MKTPDFMSYERYKKKKNDNSKEGVAKAITAFFVALILFILVAKSLSPNVDVSIGEDTQTDAKETGLGVKKFIDDRLKLIQMDDNSNGIGLKDAKNKSESMDKKKNSDYDDASFDKEAQSLEEKVNLPSKNKVKNPFDPQVNGNSQVNHTAPRPKAKDLAAPFASSQSTRPAKVYVGRYSTMEQARVAQGILMDSGLGVSPYVKDLGGTYTLQVGSYSSRAKAEGIAGELQRNSFPARVTQD